MLMAGPLVRDQNGLFAEVVLHFTRPGTGASTIKYQTSANAQLGIRHNSQNAQELDQPQSIANLLVLLEHMYNLTGRPFEIDDTADGLRSFWTFRPSCGTTRPTDYSIQFLRTHPKIAIGHKFLIWLLITSSYLLSVGAVAGGYYPLGFATGALFSSGALLSLWLYIASVRRAKRDQLFVTVDYEVGVIRHNLYDQWLQFFKMTVYFKKEETNLKTLCENLEKIQEETKSPLELTAP